MCSVAKTDSIVFPVVAGRVVRDGVGLAADRQTTAMATKHGWWLGYMVGELQAFFWWRWQILIKTAPWFIRYDVDDPIHVTQHQNGLWLTKGELTVDWDPCRGFTVVFARERHSRCLTECLTKWMRGLSRPAPVVHPRPPTIINLRRIGFIDEGSAPS